MSRIQLKDKVFVPYISEEEIQAAIEKMAIRMQEEIGDKNPVFIGILSGCFLFASDLIRRFKGDCEVAFVRLSSYSGTSSTGQVAELMGLEEDITGRTVVVIEDIVDTGLTLEKILALLGKYNPSEIRIATLLMKPEAYKGNRKIEYVGVEIPNKFVVGYGLDYDGLGRNIPAIYQIV
ncbi:MAG: hypoxanthine phosphoribosyltransferase [Bacteroidetes bacterium]|nr:hypoxanthine phosphoribosyltransferase [Bacteroidota bacterium]MBU1719599.1 hypoxanthine phosphoribosyltransferase [Bacteroidota bacterium]